MTTSSTREQQARSEATYDSLALLAEASEAGKCSVDAAKKFADRLQSRLPNLPPQPFEAANTLTRSLLNTGWQYDTRTYRLQDMIKRKAGNCLGLTCLYGTLLEARGFNVEYELVTGPKGYWRSDEQRILDVLVSGQVFHFDAPLIPERHLHGCELLHFCTLEHPRLILDGQRFETTVLTEQAASIITGESVRTLEYNDLVNLILYERANTACNGKEPNFFAAQELLTEALKKDPQNKEVWYELANISLQLLEDSDYEQARDAYTTANGNDSQYRLHRYYLTGEKEDLDLGLQGNPTDMRLWSLKHVVLEPEIRTQRANFAVAAQCIARSEMLNLGNFYAQHAWLLAKLFPEDAVSLLKQARDAKTDPFGFYLALVALGSCKKVRWERRDKPVDCLRTLLKQCPPQSPLQKAKLLYIAQDHAECRQDWQTLRQQFGSYRTFQATVRVLEQQWKS